MRAHLIVKMFEMYATGNYSIRQIRDEMEKLGLKSKAKNQKPESTGKIYHDLKNPFYYGQQKIKKGTMKGLLYNHKY
ncbi:MAG: recombinase family protein [Minisyncoccales bacterium]